MKQHYSRRFTIHDSMPWSDESWYYDDDFYNDGYYEDMPAVLSKVGGAIASGAKRAKGAIGSGVDKVKGLFKKKPKTLTERGKDMLKSAGKSISKKAKSVGKAISKGAKAAGKWVKKNPVKAAAAAGAGIGAGIAANRAVSGMTGRDSMFGMTAYDSLPWVNKRRYDSALKRYIDRRVKQVVSRLNDIDPGEFDPSIPLYNNRLPQAKAPYRQSGPEMQMLTKSRGSIPSNKLNNFEQMAKNIASLPDSLRREYNLPLAQGKDVRIVTNLQIVSKYMHGSPQFTKRDAFNAIVAIKEILETIRRTYFFDESTAQAAQMLSHAQKLQGKITLNTAIKALDDIAHKI